MKSLRNVSSKVCKLAISAAGLYFAFDLFIRQTPIEIGPETTCIAEPLDKDGLPNYALAIREKQREGVTPENNAAALMWQAVRPSEVTDEQHALVCRELAIRATSEEQFLTDLSGDAAKERLMAWRLAAERDAADRKLDVIEQVVFAETTDAWIKTLRILPWKRDDAPPLASWLDENKSQLDLLVAAAARPKFYSPSPNVLANHDTPAFALDVPQVDLMRRCVYSLATRAAYRMGNGQFTEAWEDCLACWRFGEHASNGQLLADRFVGTAARKQAMRLTVALLQAPDLPVALAHQVRADLDGMQGRVDFVPTLDFAERLQFLDAALRVTKHRPVGEGNADKLSSLPITVDANMVLKVGNDWFDRIVKAASNPDRKKRESELSIVENDLFDQADGSNSYTSLLSAAFNRTTRSKIVANATMLTMMPPIGAILSSEKHAAASYQLAKLAACLKLYHAAHGEYPKTLESLAPDFLPTLPLDPFSGTPFIYKRCEEGYLLYSVSENGSDDGGDDYEAPIIDGEWLSPESWSDFSAPDFFDADIVIRIPLPLPPPLKLPTKPAPDDAEP